MGLPAWIEVRVAAPRPWLELVAEALLQHAPLGVAFGAPSLGSEPLPEGWEHARAFVPEEEATPLWREALRRDLEALAGRTGAQELAGLRASFHRLPPEDYARSWRRDFRPFRLGRLCVVPPDFAGRERPGDARMVLEPGGAFGTGRHPSTRACLLELERRLRGGERVLDAGSGSGILAVAAVLLGAGEAVGYDNDRHSLPYARHLAEANGVADRCRFEQAELGALPEDSPFDGLLANLYADLIAGHAADLAARLVPGGWFAFAGCLSAHRERTRAAAEAAGLRIERTATRGRWDAYSGVRTA